MDTAFGTPPPNGPEPTAITTTMRQPAIMLGIITTP